MKAIFEVDQEHDSVVLWEAGVGHRVVFRTVDMALTSSRWLTEKSCQFHLAKDETGSATIEVYGERRSPYEFVRHYLSLCKSAGLKVQEEALTRPPSEFW